MITSLFFVPTVVMSMELDEKGPEAVLGQQAPIGAQGYIYEGAERIRSEIDPEPEVSEEAHGRRRIRQSDAYRAEYKEKLRLSALAKVGVSGQSALNEKYFKKLSNPGVSYEVITEALQEVKKNVRKPADKAARKRARKALKKIRAEQKSQEAKQG